MKELKNKIFLLLLKINFETIIDFKHKKPSNGKNCQNPKIDSTLPQRVSKHALRGSKVVLIIKRLECLCGRAPFT